MPSTQSSVRLSAEESIGTWFRLTAAQVSEMSVELEQKKKVVAKAPISASPKTPCSAARADHHQPLVHSTDARSTRWVRVQGAIPQGGLGLSDPLVRRA